MELNPCEIGGKKYTPGICIFCLKPFDEESSRGFAYGHHNCAVEYERELNRKENEELIADCPPGTRFDLAGGAAVD